MQSRKNKKFKKGFKAIGVAIGAAVMSFAMAFSACAVPLSSSGDNDNNKTLTDAPVAAASTQNSNSLRYIVSNAADFEATWNNAVTVSKTKGKQVYFILDADWEAPTSPANHPFGADSDGFSYGRINVPSGADIVLDLNGHTIDRGLDTSTNYGGVLFVDGGKLTVEDSSGNDGIITGGYTTWGSGVSDGGGGIRVGSGELTLNGGTIKGNTSWWAGGINILNANCKFTMNGGVITNNLAHEGGGGILINGGDQHFMNGGEISGNHCATADNPSKQGGGGVFVENGSKFTMNNGLINGNEAYAEGGGGVFVNMGGKFIMNGGEVSYNTCSGCDGGVCLMWNGGTSINNTGTTELNGGVITGNTSKSANRTGAVTVTLAGSLVIGGPVRIYGNFGASGEARDLCIGSSYPAQIKSGASLLGGQTALIGLCRYGNYSGKTLYNAVTNFTDADNGPGGTGVYHASFFFANEENIVVTASGTTVQLYNASSYVPTIPQRTLDWEVELDDGSTINTTGPDIDLDYGKSVNSVKATYSFTQNSTTKTVTSYWSADGASTTYNPMMAINYSDEQYVAGAFNSVVKNAGYYSFIADQNDSTYGEENSGYGSMVLNWSLCIHVVPKDIRVNVIDKATQYGTVADLYAEEDVLDSDGKPTGVKIKTDLDPSTPLLAADASVNLKDYISLVTEASTGNAEVGQYNIKASLKNNAPANIKNNYKFSFNSATYTVGPATVTFELSGSNTYSGVAQNSASVKVNYPTGFAGTKMGSTDYELTYPIGGCVNVDTYDKDDISVALKSSVKNFVIAKDDPVSGEYKITKAKLTCTADDKSVGVGDAAPTYTVTYSGFKGTDTAATVITTAATCTCTYTTTSPKGKYDIIPSGAAADNYEFEYKKGTLTVGVGTAAKPTIAIAAGITDVYDGNLKTFNVTGYNTTAIKNVTLSDTTNFTWDPDTATITATKAGKCTVTFTLDTDKYTWADGTMTPEEVEIEVKPMPLVFAITTTGDTSSVWDYGATGTIDYALTTTTVSTDTLALEYRYYLTSEGSGKAVKVTGTSLDVSTLASGNYTAEVRLIAKGETGYSADNENYTIDANSANTKSFKIDAGNAETSGIIWQYSLNGNPATDLFDSDDKQVTLTYGLKADGSENEIEIPFPDISAATYLTRDTTKLTQGMLVVKVEDDGSETTVTKITKPGNYKITIALVSDEDHLFDNGTKYGEVSKTFTVDKAQVNLSGNNLKLEYGWINDDTAEVDWKDYDPNNLPVYQEKFVYIRVKGGTNYPAGITNAEIVNENTDYIGDRDMPGTVKANVKFTLDSNYVYVDGGTTYDTTFIYQVSIELSKQKIPLSWVLDTVKDAAGNEVLDANGLPYQIYVLDFSANPDLAQYVKYEYYYADTTGLKPIADTIVPASASGTTDNAQLDHLIDVDGAGKMNGSSTKSVDIIIRPVIDTTISGYENYVLDLPGNVADGADQYTKLGQKKSAVTVTQVKSELVYGTKVDSLDSLYTLMKGTAAYNTNFYTAVIYKGNDSANAVDVSSFDFATADVGTYTIKFELKASVVNSDALSKSSLTLEITQQEIEVPQITGNIVFNSETQSFEKFLDSKYQEYLDAGIISAVSGRATARDAGSYVAVIEIINANYKWKLPADVKSESKKAVVRLSLADDEVSSGITLDSTKKQAEYSWTIAPFKLGTDIIDLSGKDGAKVNINKLPEWARTMITEGDLIAGIAYYADQAGTTPLTDEEIVLKGGREYFVGAVLGGNESKNFTFANDGTIKNASPAVTYKVPQSGAAAFANNVKEFMTRTWLGLPIWAWFVIALAVLIMLIIIIAVCAKRRKTKEQRAEEKARKEEEKQRREEERRMQQERLDAERELARAKQEAELEKIRAQAQMAGAGMASMSMQQQPVQQQMPQQMPQQPVQQPMQMPQQQPMQMQQPMQVQPVMMQQPMQMPQPAQQSGGMDAVMLALLQSQSSLQAQITEMRATQDASTKAEMEMLKMQMLTGNVVPPQSGARVNNGQGISAELLGEAIVTAFTRLAANNVKPAELPAPETETATTSAVYPPDAVVTTTTTVDTTQKQVRRERDDRDTFADVDGFYDSID